MECIYKSTYGLSFVGRFVLNLLECPLLEVSLK